MTEQQIYDGVIMHGTTDFALVVDILGRHDAGWCLIGGLAVNAYAPPVYTADCDLVVVAADLEQILADLRAADFRIRKFPFSINVQRRAAPAERSSHLLMVQFSTAPELQEIVARATLRPVFGLDVPVAALPDLVRAKLAAWSEPRRRAGKRRKDEFDLLRLAQHHPGVVDSLLPAELRRKAQSDRAQIADDPAGDGWGSDDDWGEE